MGCLLLRRPNYAARKLAEQGTDNKQGDVKVGKAAQDAHGDDEGNDQVDREEPVHRKLSASYAPVPKGKRCDESQDDQSQQKPGGTV